METEISILLESYMSFPKWFFIQMGFRLLYSTKRKLELTGNQSKFDKYMAQIIRLLLLYVNFI